jgi:hypothetical protein
MTESDGADLTIVYKVEIGEIVKSYLDLFIVEEDLVNPNLLKKLKIWKISGSSKFFFLVCIYSKLS